MPLTGGGPAGLRLFLNIARWHTYFAGDASEGVIAPAVRLGARVWTFVLHSVSNRAEACHRDDPYPFARAGAPYWRSRTA